MLLIQVELNKKLVTCNLIASSFKKESSNWRMMAYLLGVSRAPIDPALKSFTNDRIEWFFYGNIKKKRVAYTENDSSDESFEQILS